MTLLTIIIPHHNSVESLQRLLLSIPKRDWIEVIVIDDNSSAQNVVELKEVIFFNDNVSLYSLPSDQRWAGTARNLGITKAKGKWLIFADADDFFTSGFEYQLAPYLDSNFDLVYFKPISQNDSGEEGKRHLKYARILKQFCQKREPNLLYQFYVPWSKLIAKQHVMEHNIRFDKVRASNDVMFGLKVAYHANKMDCCEQSIYCVTESHGSLTKQKSKEVLDSRFEAVLRYNQFLLEHNIQADFLPTILHIWNARHYGFMNVYQKWRLTRQKGFPVFYSISYIISILYAKIFKR